MIYKSLFIGAAVISSAQGFFVQPPRLLGLSKQTEVHMAAGLMVPLNPRYKSLEKVKDRYGGRLDLGSMTDETEIDEESFMDADSEETDPPQIGEELTGTIVEMDDNGALLEIGGKMSGYLPVKEASLVPVKQVTIFYE